MPSSAAPKLEPSWPAGKPTGMPSTSASICRHSGLRAKPPVARSSRTSLPAARTECQHQRELLADALQRGADQVRAAVRARQPDVGAAGQRAPVRRPLAEQVGQHDQPVAAGRHRGRELAAAAPPACSPRSGASASPAHSQHDAAVVDRAADDPAAGGQRVAEHAALRVDRGRSTITRSAPLVPIEQAATPGRTAPRPRLASGPSPAPTTTGVPAGSPRRGGAGGSSRQHRGRRDELGQLLGGDPGELAAPRRPSRSRWMSISPVPEAHRVVGDQRAGSRSST